MSKQCTQELFAYHKRALTMESTRLKHSLSNKNTKKNLFWHIDYGAKRSFGLLLAQTHVINDTNKIKLWYNFKTEEIHPKLSAVHNTY